MMKNGGDGRQSLQSMARMKQIALLASENTKLSSAYDSGNLLRKKNFVKGESRKKLGNDDTFGMADEDWLIYQEIVSYSISECCGQ